MLFILLFATGLRFHKLGAQSLWNDEGSSYVQTTRSFADIAANAARDIHPPGYYALLKIWRTFTGEAEFALRSLSAFASILSVAFTYALGRRLHSPAAGLAAALFVALNTFSIYYAQEARMYALLALWAVMSMWALAGLFSLSSWVTTVGDQRAAPLQRTMLKWLLVLALVNAAGLYTQYAYPFIMLAQGACFLLWLGSRLLHLIPNEPQTEYGERGTQHSALSTFLAYVAANLLTLILYLPWLPNAWHQLTTWPQTGQPTPPEEALSILTGWFTFGVTYERIAGAAAFIPAALFLVTLGALLGLLIQDRQRWWGLLLTWALMPVGLFLALGLFRPANLKLLLPSQIGFALWLGIGLASWWGLARGPGRANRVTLALALLLGGWLVVYGVNGLAPLYDDPVFQRADYRAMAAAISADPRPGDAIILDAPNQAEVFRYYYKGAAPIYPLPPGLGGDDAQTRALVREVIREHARIFVLFWGERERDPNRVVETTLDNEAYEAGTDVWYGDVRFARYVTPVELAQTHVLARRFGQIITLESYALSATTLPPGDVLQIRLDWRAERPIEMRYKVFLQLLRSDDSLAQGAQRDAEPGGGSTPTTTWKPNETITDRHGLLIPPDIAPGEYRLIVGLYDANNPNLRLPLIGGGDYVVLERVQVR